MNFPSFTTTETTINQDSIMELLQNLMHTQSALQLRFQQPAFDLLILIYLGDPNLEFDFGKLTAMLIQVKHRERATKPVVTEALIQEFFPDNSQNPIIVSLLDIGLASTSFKSVESCNPHVYALYASGKYLFQALWTDQELDHNCSTMLGGIQPPKDSTLHTLLCQRNIRFNIHT